PEKKFNAATFRDLLSTLLKATLEFIASEGTINDPAVFNVIAKELRQRGSRELGEKKILQAISAIEDLHGVDSEFFLLKYRLEAERFAYDITFDKLTNAKAVLKQAEEINRANHYIIIFTVLEIISNYMNLIVYSEKFGAVFPADFLESSLKDYNVEGLINTVKGKSGYDFILEMYSALLKAFLNGGNLAVYTAYR